MIRVILAQDATMLGIPDRLIIRNCHNIFVLEKF